MGKTTSIKCLLSLINHQGQIKFDGNKPSDFAYMQDIGVIMDDSFLAKDWTLKEVNKAMKVGYDRWEEEIFFSYLDNFNLETDSKVKELSRGMKIKLMLAIALSHKANLLILDEPTSGMDPSMRDEFTDILQEFVEDEGNTVLFSTHITQDLDRIADYIIFIDEGKIVFEDSKEEFYDTYLVVKGGLDDLGLIKDIKVLGLKRGSYGFEALVEKDKFKIDSDKLVVEKPDIERVMVLFGRDK